MLTATAAFFSLAFVLGEPRDDGPSQFDFWIGEWNAAGEQHLADNKLRNTSATNSIQRVMGGKVIQENFHMEGLSGMSWSVYNPALKEWRQTWVDDGGSYIALTGGFKDGKMTLTTAKGPKGGVYRMVYHNIKSDSFDWDWEFSKDSGKTWGLQWHLHYQRKG